MAKQALLHSEMKGAEKAIDYLCPKTGEHLIPKYESFCLDYAQHFSPNLALEAAGYPMEGKTKKQLQQAFRHVMTRQDVRMRVQALIREKAEHVGVGPDWVVMKWMEVLDRCMQGSPVLDNEGNETGEWKFDSRGANNVLHDMATYMGMFQKAATDSKPVTVNVNFAGKKKPPIDGEVEVVDG
jgi:hypothetical protein